MCWIIAFSETKNIHNLCLLVTKDVNLPLTNISVILVEKR